MRRNHYVKLILAIVFSEFAGVVGAIFTASAIPSWYASLAKPALSPPNWLFGPVWTALYFLMGISAFLIWRKGLHRKDIRIALAVFVLQLLLSIFWSIIFFGLHAPGAAFIEIILLWTAILATIIVFSRLSKPAAWLLTPYVLWVSFAAYLNYSIWTLN